MLMSPNENLQRSHFIPTEKLEFKTNIFQAYVNLYTFTWKHNNLQSIIVFKETVFPYFILTSL